MSDFGFMLAYIIISDVSKNALKLHLYLYGHIDEINW